MCGAGRLHTAGGTGGGETCTVTARGAAGVCAATATSSHSGQLPKRGSRRGEIATIAIVPAGVLSAEAAYDSATAAAAVASGSRPGAAALGSVVAATALAAAEAAATGAGWKGGPWPASQAPALATMVALKRLSLSLKEALAPFGPVLLLNSTTIGLQFPTAFERLDVLFYRSKVRCLAALHPPKVTALGLPRLTAAPLLPFARQCPWGLPRSRAGCCWVQ